MISEFQRTRREKASRAKAPILTHPGFHVKIYLSWIYAAGKGRGGSRVRAVADLVSPSGQRAMIEGVITGILEAAARFLLGRVLVPVIWLVATPALLLAALLSPRPYFEALGDRYRRVARFWLDREHLVP